MYKFRTTVLVEHENVVTTYVIIEVSLALASIEKNKVLHGMHSCSDTNVRNYFVTEKWLKQGIRSQKKGKERFLLPKWREMLTFVFDKS